MADAVLIPLVAAIVILAYGQGYGHGVMHERRRQHRLNVLLLEAAEEAARHEERR